MVGIYLAGLQLSKYPPLFTSTLVNNIVKVVVWVLVMLFLNTLFDEQKPALATREKTEENKLTV